MPTPIWVLDRIDTKRGEHPVPGDEPGADDHDLRGDDLASCHPNPGEPIVSHDQAGHLARHDLYAAGGQLLPLLVSRLRRGVQNKRQLVGPLPEQQRMAGETTEVLDAVGPRLRALRQQRHVTLAGLAEATGISVTTLSRLESGHRRPSLELLLPLARAHRVPLDELVAAPPTGDPRVHLKPRTLHGMTVVPLTEQPGPLQAYKMVLPAGPTKQEPDLRTHEGYEWLYVLSGRLRLVLASHDLVLGRGEAAEFDTRVPHWFGNAGTQAVEYLTLFGRQGERVHLRTGSAERRRSR